MYFRHLELRGYSSIKDCKKRASNDISGPQENFQKVMCRCSMLKRATKRAARFASAYSSVEREVHA